MNLNPSRREFSATALGLPAALGAVADGGDAVAFFVVGDTHFLAGKEDPAKIDPRSAKVTSKLIDTLNRLPGTEIPAAAGLFVGMNGGIARLVPPPECLAA